MPPYRSKLDKISFALRSTGARDFENPKRTGIHTRGYLPHVKRQGVPYFVTFRLADALPREVVARYKADLNSCDSDETHRELRNRIERYLDAGMGACWLARPEIAQLVSDALQFWTEDRYILGEWVVMPNHIHVIVQPLGTFTLSEILQSWKRFTARQANKILERTGKEFWQTESYDHWIRNEEERAKIERYIHNNPVKAGLCSHPRDWRWSSAATR